VVGDALHKKALLKYFTTSRFDFTFNKNSRLSFMRIFFEDMAGRNGFGEKAAAASRPPPIKVFCLRCRRRLSVWVANLPNK